MVLTNKINVFLGAITAFLAYVFGEHWGLFAFFLLLNCLDYFTRWRTARLTGTENSKAGWTGILKKLGYWVMIALGFSVSVVFIKLGDVIGINLGITTLLGWYVLATLCINEIRSILENLVEAGDDVPAILIKGLEIVNKAIDGKIKIGDNGVETVLHTSEDEIQAKGTAKLQVEDLRTLSAGGTPCKRGEQ